MALDSGPGSKCARDGPVARPLVVWLWPQAGAGWDHRRPAMVDSVDNLAGIDPLEIDRRDPKMGMPELSLDDRQRDRFVRHLDRVRVP